MRYTTPITGPATPLLACILLATAGCVTPPRVEAPTRADRLMAAYEELAEGRFLTLSDFETPEALKLCQVVSASGKAKVVLDSKRGRRETGGGALRFTTAGDDDVLTIGGGHDPAVYMKRDWRPYDLLLMSIHSPRAGVTARVGMTGSLLDRRQHTGSPITLDKGWNLLKFDLAGLGEHIFLDDVRRIEMSARGIDRPIDLLVDDLILTKHRRVLMGDPEGKPGALYVLEVGRRWRVGVTGGFEIGFQNGQIVEWFEPAGDPTRLRNFVSGAVLGPTIVNSGARSIEGGERTIQRGSLGDRVRVSQRLIEQSPLRVVIECHFDGTSPSVEEGASPPSESYVYTIYPSGHIYAEARRRVPTEQQSSPSSGISFSFASKDKEVIARPRALKSENERWAAYANISSPEGGPSALLVVPVGSATDTIEAWHERHRLNLLVQPDRRLSAVQQWHSAIRLGGVSGLSAEDIEAEAAAMRSPPVPRIEVGRLGERPPGQPSSPVDGADGSISLLPDRGYLRFVLDRSWPARMMPTYLIEQSEKREATVYVNHLIHDQVARDSGGRLLVQLPADAAGTRVEILLRAANPTSQSGFDTR